MVFGEATSLYCLCRQDIKSRNHLRTLGATSNVLQQGSVARTCVSLSDLRHVDIWQLCPSCSSPSHNRFGYKTELMCQGTISWISAYGVCLLLRWWPMPGFFVRLEVWHDLFPCSQEPRRIDASGRRAQRYGRPGSRSPGETCWQGNLWSIPPAMPYPGDLGHPVRYSVFLARGGTCRAKHTLLFLVPHSSQSTAFDCKPAALLERSLANGLFRRITTADSNHDAPGPRFCTPKSLANVAPRHILPKVISDGTYIRHTRGRNRDFR